MEEKMFEELKESIRQAGAILRKEMKPAKITYYPDLDVKGIRRKLELSQSQFSTLLGISVGTLRGWEQGRRKPHGPSQVLLKIVEEHPEVVLEVNRIPLRKKAG